MWLKICSGFPLINIYYHAVAEARIPRRMAVVISYLCRVSD
jgi:hypothetical protein